MPSEEDYGYAGRLESIRGLYHGMPRAYLDNAASPLTVSTLPYKAAELLVNAPVAVNPHSSGPLGDRTTNIIDEVRSEILQLLNVSALSHEVVFTSNATAAAKLVGESLHASHFVYSVDSHTSIVGLRTLAKSWATHTDADEGLIEPESVVSWPLQSNFDGTRYPGAEWVQKVHEKDGLVLLDTASFAATEMPDLQRISCDFAILSFYKIFGLPDLGALVVKKSQQVREFLGRKKYFGGGTVAALAPSTPWMARQTSDSISSWLEDGTLPFHSIITLKAAFLEFRRIYGLDFMDKIQRHTKAVAKYCRDRLSEVEQCEVYGTETNCGPIVTFRLESVGHYEFSVAAALRDVHVRAGTLCNIGAFTLRSQMTDEKIMHNYKTLGKKCNDEISFVDNDPTGVVRASFGAYSSYADVDALLDVINEFVPLKSPNGNGHASNGHAGTGHASNGHSNNGHARNSRAADCHASNGHVGNGRASNGRASSGNASNGHTALHAIGGAGNSHEPPAVVDALYTYPIKSCGGLRVDASLVTPAGLQYDRTFCIIEISSKRVLSMKKHKTMVFLKPTVHAGSLVIEYSPLQSEGASRISVPMNAQSWRETQEFKNLVLNLDPTVMGFFSRAIGVDCTIAKSMNAPTDTESPSSSGASRETASFANSSPLLVVNTASGEDIGLHDLSVFRPNIVLKTSEAWKEDEWAKLILRSTENSGVIALQGKCRRCNMICITGDGTIESFPYMQLCKYRKQQGRIYFGQHAALDGSHRSMRIKVGDAFETALSDH